MNGTVAAAPTETFLLVNGVVLTAVGLALAPLAIALVRHLFRERVVFFARWGFSHVGLVALTWLMAMTLTLRFVPADADGLTLLGFNLLPFAAAAALVLYFAQRLHPESWRALGGHPGGLVRAVGAGWASYVMLMPLLAGSGLLWRWLWPKLGGTWKTQEVADMLLALPQERLVWAALIAILLMPFLEELLFRGFLQPLFVQNFGARGGIALTSFLFALLHGGPPFLSIFVLSVVLGGVMLRTQRLAAAFAIHALHNGVTLALLLWAPEGVDLLQ